ncbi:hypothetical protein Ate01nite_54690 [Actinoplanes teichomyceticus]|nr:hypothetical protein Ate01nite_54690 [Actinoplanes teichomyceticus]
MSAVSDRHDPRPSAPHWPTAVLPTVAERSREQVAGRRRRIVLGSAGAFLALSIGYWAVSDPDDDTPAPAAAPVTASAAAPVVTTTEPEATAEATTTSPAAPPAATAEPVATRQVRPGALLAQMQREINLLVRREQLERDDAESLTKRLRRVAEQLRRNEPEAAARRLKDFAKKLVGLHRDGDISQDGFDALARGAGLLARQLPPL